MRWLKKLRSEAVIEINRDLIRKADIYSGSRFKVRKRSTVNPVVP
jgi:hypothetical protein